MTPQGTFIMAILVAIDYQILFGVSWSVCLCGLWVPNGARVRCLSSAFVGTQAPITAFHLTNDATINMGVYMHSCVGNHLYTYVYIYMYLFIYLHTYTQTCIATSHRFGEHAICLYQDLNSFGILQRPLRHAFHTRMGSSC